MTATAETRWITPPTIKSRYEKRLSRLSCNRRKPLYQAVFATQPGRRRARTAVCNCINLGKNIDPACGSGNFLTETYIRLRHLEDDIIGLLQRDQMTIGDADFNPILISIGQFYGIEINDFAVTVVFASPIYYFDMSAQLKLAILCSLMVLDSHFVVAFCLCMT